MRKTISFLLALFIATQVYADSIITGSKPFTFIPGTVISSSQVNADFDYIINQVNTNAAKNGVNSSITALLGLTTPISPGVGGSPIYTSGAAGGTADAITVSSTQPDISSYSLVAGNFVLFVASATNTTATTLDVNSTGVTAINKTTTGGLTALTGGEIVNGQATLVYYDGTRYVLINQAQLFGARTTISTAATTDLSLAGGHNVLIDGSGTITSFGSNASANLPLYYAKCNGTVIITGSGDIDLPGGQTGFLTCKTGDTFLARYSGANWLIEAFWPKNNMPSLGSINRLLMTADATQVSLFANRAILCNDADNCISSIDSIDLDIVLADSGVNGLDTGSPANNSWYNVFIISDGQTTAGLLSLSEFSPTLPSGYTYFQKAGMVRTGGAATLLRTRQIGNRTQYTVITGSTTPNLPIMASGNAGSPTVPTWSAISVSNYVPPTATSIQGVFGAVTSGGTYSMILAPNDDYGGRDSTSNPPPIKVFMGGNTGWYNLEFDFILESTNIYYASASLPASNPYVLVKGWVDRIPVN